jgi:hypothetical protein
MTQNNSKQHFDLQFKKSCCNIKNRTSRPHSSLFTMVYNTPPPSVSAVLAERSTKLRDQNFPQPIGSNLADLIDEVIAAPSVADRFLLDLAIVTTRHAHAFDVDENGDFFFSQLFARPSIWKKPRSTGVTSCASASSCWQAITHPDRPLGRPTGARYLYQHAYKLPPSVRHGSPASRR